MLKLGRLYDTSREFDLLVSLKKCNQSFTRNKQLLSHIISSTPTLKKTLHQFLIKPTLFVTVLHMNDFAWQMLHPH
jgi:hypothetical protein